MKDIEIVVAVRNEAATLELFTDSINQIKVDNVRLKIFFVEDGSRDNTVDVLEKLTLLNKNIRFHSIKNTFGQGMALSYGIINSNADAVITADIDGSHPVETMKNMIELYLKGYNIIQGNRIAYDRKYLYRKIASKIYFVLFTFFTGVNLYKQNVHFRLMDKEAINTFKKTRKSWYSARLKRSNLKNRKIFYLNFVAPERQIGVSKFNLKRLLKFAFTCFITLTDIPMFILLSCFFLGIAFLVYLLLSPAMSYIIILLCVTNIVTYMAVNKTDYLNKIVLLKQVN